MKRILPLFVVSILVLSGLGAVAFPIPNVETIEISSMSYGDELDQYQEKYDASTCLLGTVFFAQSFKPSLETLTRVKLFMNKIGDLYGNSILSIRESLSGDNLTSALKESIEINHDFEWIEFDFPDIQVTSGETYYIILKPDPDSDGGNGFNYIGWAFGLEDPYPKGSPFWKYNGSWSEGIPGHSSADYTFKTYGSNINNPPSPPIINGPNTGKPDDYLSYTFVSVDPDGDNVYYEVDWGDGSVMDWTGPYPSNEIQVFNHSWSEQGNFTIKGRAKDENGEIGGWGTYEVSMPKNKMLNFNYPLIIWLFERFPNLFPVLRQVMGL